MSKNGADTPPVRFASQYLTPVGGFSGDYLGQEWEEADFINHSCNPNCGIKGHLQIVAMRDIESGEEITFDYAMTESSDYSMDCKCGAKNCRKTITGNDWKLPILQKRYNGYFSNYIQIKLMNLIAILRK